MAGRKKTKKTTRRGFSRTSVVKKRARREEISGGFADYFRFSESYTSLILGIVVVIIASVLLISFLRGREFKNTPSAKQDISSAKIEPELTREPTVEEGNAKSPTIQPTQPEQLSVPTAQPIQGSKGTYTVKPGDDLWKIAETVYNDGYKWTFIAKANNITNPGMIFSGNVLKIPAAEKAPVATSTTSTQQQQPAQQPVIVGSSYTIRRGDTLWDIAERRYKNGYRWVDIAKANNLTEPNLIHAENILRLPQ